MRLDKKKIILGITGSIAAYKAVFLLRLLVKEGAEVQVVITQAGKEFITPVTLSALSGKPIISEFFGANDGVWNSHVDLGLWADLMLVAPATATTIGKMANGIADNMLVTTYLSAKCPVFVAPAMDLDMFAHPSTQNNLKILQEFGNIIIDPGEGQLASGLEGKGRMEEPENILEIVIDYFERKKKLLNKTFLVTAGPTFEKIDPVRFIGNYSSGKMGYSIAEELAAQGADVILVSGPVSVFTNKKGINVIRVESADEMFSECVKHFGECNGAVMCAAVADFTPVKAEFQKTKRGNKNWDLELQPTKDIAAALGKAKSDKQILVGFALETNDEIINAKKKLQKKKFDFIVLNSLNEFGAGFQVDTNKITIIDKNNNQQSFELKSKKEVAVDIVDKMISLLP
ncbi:MAG: bifunctional phosphopantothenoylcysteine decarboxylase/phosphopantothenate--cysteine ligase CoaBC [Prolixibacteraceae bacterium]|jgi:phosphopantothenoylcysteine decarboxylase / phosphopantothenate---cysteine ligase|nr:bifunctional phosphopantothenoylcysteine decarboxylase/phosphopantothenate--cysteine ligase CoaBC [Prolixibacteraceae bacterium]MBT6997418.1 bifunctional phosphopantothenoylcysteine decarboxylase/phosphopantothenate--cysteine ligase CoaBC [Prolixibacteraceae bacterium]MBT7396629.1 bifunctional phosphopantothenoylcysteine decarboxylase/phosphopantothenate--cysteine ligase CoaBC [Prolixibacteraceae bacterium]